MTKRVKAKIDTYQNTEGKTVGKYSELGVLLSNDNGDYMLLDPSVSLAGILAKQNAMARATSKPERDMVMVSIFEDQPQQSQQQNNGFDNNFDDDLPDF